MSCTIVRYNARIPVAELDQLDAGALPCIEVRPGTLGYQQCRRPDGHPLPHISQDGVAYTIDEVHRG